MSDFDDWMKAQEPAQAPPKPSYMDLAQAKSPIDIDAQIKESLAEKKAAASEGKRLAMPGDQPRAYAEGSPEAPSIAKEASIASAANAETQEHKATRELNAFISGAKDAVPFYPRMAGLWRAKFEAARQVVQAAVGNRSPSIKEIWAEVKRANDEQFKQTHEEIKRDISGSPVHAMMGAAPIMFATPGGLSAKTAEARVGGGVALGALYGSSAADRPGVTSDELARGAVGGALVGGAGAGLGEAARSLFRGAEKRQDNRFIQELVRTEAGEGSNAMLARNKEGLVREYEAVIKQRHDPEIRKAVNMPEGQGAPIISKKIQPYAASNDLQYKLLDKAAVGKIKPTQPEQVWYHGTSSRSGLSSGDMLDPKRGQFNNAVWATSDRKVAEDFAKSAAAVDGGKPVVYQVRLKSGAKIDKATPENMIEQGTDTRFDSGADAILTEEHGAPALAILSRGVATVGKVPKSSHVGLMTGSRLLDSLEKAKSNVSAEAATRIAGIQNDLKGHVIPRIWKGEEVIPSARLRHWLTSVQDSAARVPGSLNATQTYETTMEAAREANRIVNDYFDSIGAPKIMKKIRSNNEAMVPLIRIRDALEVKGKKEKLAHIGLGKVMEEQTRKLELGAAAGALASGHAGTAAALVARPLVTRAAKRTALWVDREILEPMQVAAAKGATSAQLARYAVERGLPQGAANYAATVFTKKYVKQREPDPETAQSPISGAFGQKLLKDLESTPPEGGDNTALMQTLESLRSRR